MVKKLSFLIILALCSTSVSLERFNNYTSVISVRDIYPTKENLWAATSGGLYCLDKKTDSSALYTDIVFFPDLNLTSLCPDDNGNIWIGTERGYLYHRQSNGTQTVYNAYYAAKWDIKKIISYNGLLIIASSKGCSIFDPGKGISTKSAIHFDSFTGSNVNDITVFRDTLFLGCDEGIASLYMGLNGDSLNRKNFFDKTIWDTRSTSSPMKNLYVYDNKVNGTTLLSTIITGKFVYADSVGIYLSDSVGKTSGGQLLSQLFNSVKINVLKKDYNDSSLLIGTDGYYYFRWSLLSGFKHFNIAGPTVNNYSRVYVSKGGTVWTQPWMTGSYPWNQGINALDKGRWSLYNASTLGWGVFGVMGGSDDSRGVCEARDGTMWFGVVGGGVKTYNERTGWAQYFLGEKNYSAFNYFPQNSNTWDIFPSYKDQPKGVTPWNMSSAIVQDSNGFFWIGNYDNYTGCIVIYDGLQPPIPGETDALKAHYRRLFPKTDDNWMMSVYAMNVDHKNRIFIGDNEGNLKICTYSNNPLSDPINVVYKSSNMQKIYDIATDENNATWVVTGNGLLKFTENSIQPQIMGIDTLPSFLNSIAISGSTMWLGTQGKGVVQWDQTSKPSAIDESNGLISNVVRSLFIDVKQGFLWIATDKGISKYFVGIDSPALNKKTTAFVYPNPYSLTKDLHVRNMIFKNLPGRAKVSIYSVDGGLISQATTVNLSSNQSIAEWKPSSQLIPGTYLYTVSPSGARGKILITP